MKITKKSWLAINPTVFYSPKNAEFLLYNTNNGKYILSSNTKLKEIIDRMHEKHALGVIEISDEEINNSDILDIINDAIEKNILRLIDKELFPQKPVQLMPVLNLQKDVERLGERDKRLLAANVGNYLYSLVLHINSNCNKTCTHCNNYHKQFLYCTQSSSNNQMDWQLVEHILREIDKTSVKVIKIVGGNIFLYDNFEKLLELFKQTQLDLEFYVDFYNYCEANRDLLNDFEKHILLHFPIDSNKNFCNIQSNEHFHFVVSSIEEYEYAENIIQDKSMQNYTVHPFYDGKNIDFFKENVFITTDDILSDKIAQKTIFANQKLNTNFFGELHILPEGTVLTSPNVQSVGNIKDSSLLELIYKEMLENTAWRKIRNETPCSNCTYQFLCPPISTYELALNKTSLCTIK